MHPATTAPVPSNTAQTRELRDAGTRHPAATTPPHRDALAQYTRRCPFPDAGPTLLRLPPRFRATPQKPGSFRTQAQYILRLPPRLRATPLTCRLGHPSPFTHHPSPYTP